MVKMSPVEESHIAAAREAYRNPQMSKRLLTEHLKELGIRNPQTGRPYAPATVNIFQRAARNIGDVWDDKLALAAVRRKMRESVRPRNAVVETSLDTTHTFDQAIFVAALAFTDLSPVDAKAAIERITAEAMFAPLIQAMTSPKFSGVRH